MLASHLGAGLCLAAPLPNQLPVSDLGIAVKNCQSVLAPASHVGDLDGLPGSWIHLSPGSVAVAIWGISDEVELL